MKAEDWVTENITEYYTKEELQKMLDNGRLKDLFITVFEAGERNKDSSKFKPNYKLTGFNKEPAYVRNSWEH